MEGERDDGRRKRKKMDEKTSDGAVDKGGGTRLQCCLSGREQ